MTLESLPIYAWFSIAHELEISDITALSSVSKRIRDNLGQSLFEYALDNRENLLQELKWISTHCPNVTKVDLSARHNLEPKIFGELCRMGQIRELNLCRVLAFDDNALKLLAASLPGLESLKTDSKSLTAAEAINFKNLRVLGLFNTVNLNRGVASILERHPNLTEFSLTKGTVTTQLEEKISGLTRLTFLDLRDTPVDIGVTQRMKSLRFLRIGSTNENQAHYNDKDLAYLCKNQLKELSLYNTSITERGIQENLPMFTQLQILAITCCPCGDAAAVIIANNIKGLTNLDFQNAFFSNEGIKAISSLPLQSLNIFGTEVDDEGANIIAANFPDMQVLDIESSAITEEGYSKLNYINNLSTL